MNRSGEHGTVMVETLIAFVPVFTLFLGIVQYTLLAAAQLVVHHAAVAGVRSASVVLDDDPARYGGAERLSIVDGSGSDASDLLSTLASFLLSDVATDSSAGSPNASVQYGARMAPIRNAVYAKLAAIVPARAQQTLEGKPGVSVLDGLGTEPARRLVQARHYLPVTTAITFPRSPGATELFEDRVEPAGVLTVRVTHVTPCTVPLVNTIMCATLSNVRSSKHSAAAAELQRAPAAQAQAGSTVENLRVRVLQAEASMPLQAAPYPYASQKAQPES
jgi:hypothetical protein